MWPVLVHVIYNFNNRLVHLTDPVRSLKFRYYATSHFLSHLSLASHKRNIGKQRRPSSDAAAASDQGLHCLH